MSTENSVRLMLPRQNEKSASKVEKEVDEGPLRKGESFGSKSSRRAMALGGVAGLLAAYPVAAEVNLNPKNAIVIEGEMPSQNLEDNMGVIIEEDQYITLKPGDKGEEVERLKQGFFDYGYYKNESSVNETFTTNTVEYVKKFQEMNGLPVDGIASPEFQAFFFSDKALRVDGTPVVVTEVMPKLEEIQVESETTDGAQVVSDEMVNKPETISIDVEEEKEVNQRFAEFLNGEGKYSDEELKKRVFCSYNPSTKADLGLFDMEGSSFSIQGILLGNFNIENRVFVAFGVKDRGGERKIVISEWPVKERIKAYSNIEVREMIGGSSSASFEPKQLDSIEEVSLFLDDKIGDVLAFGFYNLGDKNAFINKYQGKINEEKMNFFLDYVVPKGDINMDLASGVLIPSIKEVKMLPYQVDFIKSLRKKDLVGVSNYNQSIKLINDNIENFPLLGNITYNKYLH